MSNYFQPPVWQPHDYQVRAVNWLITHPEGALFLPPGLGKTSITLAAFLKLRELGYKHKMLVLAPLRVCQTTWQTEHFKWAQFAGLKVGLAHGPNKAAILRDPKYDIIVLNYDAISWLAKQRLGPRFFQILCCDELTKVKRTSTQRFKALKPMLEHFQFRWGLTGTPAANGLLDLFGQMLVLDQGYRFGKYITHYRLKYFHQKPRDEFNWHITPEKAAQIHAKVSDLAMYINPEEVLKLPELIHVELPVAMDKVAFNKYKELEVLCILQLQDVTLTPANAGVLTAKLRQVSGGAVYTDADRNYEVVHTAKLDALDDLVEELAGEPLLVAYNFSHEVDRIVDRHPNALVIRGGMTGEQVKKVMMLWNAGGVEMLCVQADAAAHGLNLQFGGSKLCWFSQTYNLETYLQLIARLHRQGQADTVMVYHLITEKTIDKHIRKILDGKSVTQTDLFVALRQSLLQTVT